MRLKILSLLALTVAVTASAQGQGGYQDGIVYYKADQYNKARKILSSTIGDAATDKALAYYYLGALDLRNDDLAKAKANFDKGIAANPQQPYNYVGLGHLDLLQGNQSGAEDLFKQALKIAKKDYSVQVLIARAYYKTDPVKYAKQVDKYLQEARKKSKNSEPSIYILEGDMHIDQDDPGAAAQSYEQAIFFDAGNPEGYVKYAKAYIHVNPEFAIGKLEELNREHPELAIALSELGERLYDNNQWTRAAEVYGQYMANPNHFPEDKERYAVLLYYGKKYPETIAQCDELIAQDAKNAQAGRLKMLATMELKDWDKALEAANQFLAMGYNAYSAADYNSYATILSELGQDSLALVQYQKAVDIEPTNVGNIESLSAGYYNNKDYRKAAETYDLYMKARGAEATPSDQAMAAGRWLVYSSSIPVENVADRKAAADRGIEYINLAIEKAPDNSMLLKRKAQLMYTGNGNKLDAAGAAAYEALVALLDQDADNLNTELDTYKQAWALLGNYYNSIGQKDKAQELYNKLK